MKVSVVIPNYNGADILKNYLPKILSAVGGAKVIVVDDASTDDSVGILEKQFPEVKVIIKDKNEGFAAAVNKGVRNASGDLILLLNSDVSPQQDFLKYLLPYFDDPQIFAVGCLQVRDGEIKEGRGIGKFEKGFLVHAAGALDKKNTLWVFGGAGIFRKALWEKLGGMDTIYNPFYWEDIDLSYRALKAGYKLVFEPRSIVVHEQKKGAIRNTYSPNMVKTIAYRNQFLFVWLNITDIYFLLQHFFYLPYHLIRSFLTRDFAFIKAFIMALSKTQEVIFHRFKNIKFNMISDKEILSKLGD